MKTQLYNDGNTYSLYRNGLPLNCPHVNKMLVPVATKLIQDQGQVQLHITTCSSACALFTMTKLGTNTIPKNFDSMVIHQGCRSEIYKYRADKLPMTGEQIDLEE